mmetsp:Transcript_18236/g.34123  ORF Transcript_18236/g.34123 Transcript_18236/m.34123 type:complete len:301 (+) Transcript_18236:77-979(+)
MLPLSRRVSHTLTIHSRLDRQLSTTANRTVLHTPLCPVMDMSVTNTPNWEDIFKHQQPVILRNLSSNWPATTLWSDPEYLTQKFGHVEVPVEVGGDYISAKTKHIRIPFSKAVKKLTSLAKQPGRSGGKVHYYVAQHSLLTFPGMMDDLEVPDMCRVTASGGGVQRSALWIGSAHSSSPCHFDPFQNILVQVYGVKSVWLFSPEAAPCMLTCPEPQANTSSLPFSKFCTQVDLSVEGEAITESADGASEQQKCNMSALWASSHPRYYAQLEKGDALFIPHRWWHFCKAMTSNCSVNFWWK